MTPDENKIDDLINGGLIERDQLLETIASLRSELALKEKEIEVLKRAVKTLSQFLDEKGDQLKNTKPWKPI